MALKRTKDIGALTHGTRVAVCPQQPQTTWNSGAPLHGILGTIRMDEDRSTTPTHPPPESPATLSSQGLQPLGPQNEWREVQEDAAGSQESASESQCQVPKMDSNHHSKLPRPANSQSLEPLRTGQSTHQQTIGRGYAAGLAQAAHPAHLVPERSGTPTTPGGSLSPFDWDGLETRFEKALADANQYEEELMAEFQSLVKVHRVKPLAPPCPLPPRFNTTDMSAQYFNIWASTASAHDNERASKR